MCCAGIGGNEKVIVDSKYDSGVHRGIFIQTFKEGDYFGKSLDKVLSKAQITNLEYMILYTVRDMIEEGKANA